MRIFVKQPALDFFAWRQASHGRDGLRTLARGAGPDPITAIASIQKLALMSLQKVAREFLVPSQSVQSGTRR
jgi:hypothetical protein